MSFDKSYPVYQTVSDSNDLSPQVMMIYDPAFSGYRPSQASDFVSNNSISLSGAFSGMNIINSSVQISGVNITSNALNTYVTNFPAQYKIQDGTTVGITGNSVIGVTGDFKIVGYATENTLAAISGKVSGFNYIGGALAVYGVNTNSNSLVSGDIGVTGIFGAGTTGGALKVYLINHETKVSQSGGWQVSITGLPVYVTGEVFVSNQLTNYSTETTLVGVSGKLNQILSQLQSVNTVTISGGILYTTGTSNVTVLNPITQVSITGNNLIGVTGDFKIAGFSTESTSLNIFNKLNSGILLTGSSVTVTNPLAVTGGNISVNNPVYEVGITGQPLAVTGDFKITNYATDTTAQNIFNQLKSGVTITGQPLSVNVNTIPNVLAQVSGVPITVANNNTGLNVYLINPDYSISGEFVLDPGGKVGVTGEVIVSGLTFTGNALRVWVDNQISVSGGNVVVSSGNVNIVNPVIAVTGNIVIASGFLNVDEVGISGGYVYVSGSVDPSAWLYSRTGFKQSFTAKNSAGTLGGAFVYNNANYNQYIQVFDGTNLNGTPVLIGEALAKNNFAFDIPVRGITMSNGITIANSTGTNGAITNVSGAEDCFFTVLYK